MRYRCSRARAGFTIIEVGILMTLTALLVSLGVVMFGSLVHAQRQTLQRDRLRREFMRLDHLLRRDVHAATAAEMIADGECLLHDSLGNRWTYQVSDIGLLRIHSRNGDQKQRELFSWPKGTELNISVEPAGKRKLLLLTIDPPITSGRAPARQPTYRARVLVGGLQPVTSREVDP